MAFERLAITRLAMFLSLPILAACQTEQDPSSSAMAGDWVLTFAALSVQGSGFECASVSGTLVQLEQVEADLTGSFSQGLLLCTTLTNDSIIVPAAQGRATGMQHASRVELSFPSLDGRLTGTVQGSSASGTLEYTDSTYNVTVRGAWSAQRRTPSGAVNVSVQTNSMSGQPLPSVFLVLDGLSTVPAPQNGTLLVGELTGGRHTLRLSTDGNCIIGGPPPDALNRNEQFIDIAESAPPGTIVYFVGCV